MAGAEIVCARVGDSTAPAFRASGNSRKAVEEAWPHFPSPFISVRTWKVSITPHSQRVALLFINRLLKYIYIYAYKQALAGGHL